MNGIPQAEHEIAAHPDRAISVITWIEVLAGTTLEDADKTNDLLQAFATIPITSEIAAEAVSVRRVSRLKLPDALILATAHIENRVLLTRNTKDFRSERHRFRVPYQV